MSAAYLIGAISFACVCTAIVMALGGTWVTGFIVYAVSGQIALLGLAGRAAYRGAPALPRT